MCARMARYRLLGALEGPCMLANQIVSLRRDLLPGECLGIVRVQAQASLQRLDRLRGTAGPHARCPQHEVAEREAWAEVDRPLCRRDGLLRLAGRVAVAGQQIERIGICTAQMQGLL